MADPNPTLIALQNQFTAVNTAINNYLTDPVEEFSIAGRTVRRPSLQMLYNIRAQVNRLILIETKKANVAAGLTAGGTIKVRLTNP